MTKEKIIEILEPLINYYYKGGEFEDEDLYNEDIADKLLPLFSLQKQEIVEEIKNMKKIPQVVLDGMVETELSDKGIGYNRALEDLIQTLTK